MKIEHRCKVCGNKLVDVAKKNDSFIFTTYGITYRSKPPRVGVLECPNNCRKQYDLLEELPKPICPNCFMELEGLGILSCPNCHLEIRIEIVDSGSFKVTQTDERLVL